MTHIKKHANYFNCCLSTLRQYDWQKTILDTLKPIIDHVITVTRANLQLKTLPLKLEESIRADILSL